MYRRFAFFHLAFVVVLLGCCHGARDGQGGLTSMPNPNGPYSVGWITTEFVNSALPQPFIPDTEPRRMELSIFYPVTGHQYTTVRYFPPEIASGEDVEHSTLYDLNAPNGTFEKLGLKVAPTGSHIASSQNSSTWPVLVFSPALQTTRLFYSYLLSNIASFGYVVVAFDTPYEVDIVQFSNGDIVLFNNNLSETVCNTVTAVNSRAQDESFILDQLENKTLLSSLIPGCDDCLNLTSVGAFGHSVGGATAATVLGSDKRIASALNYDGVLFGDVITQTISKPLMIMVVPGQTINNTATMTTDSSFAAMWVRLTGEKYFAILNDSKHYTYSDLPLAFQTLNLNPNDTARQEEQITDLDPVRSTRIISEYTLAFFDQSLGGIRSDLLKGPSPLYPEITFDDGASIPANTTAPFFLCPNATVSSPQP